MANILVSGAGSPWANGIYIDMGVDPAADREGCHWYKKSATEEFEYSIQNISAGENETGWTIYEYFYGEENSPCYYAADNSPSITPPLTQWTVFPFQGCIADAPGPTLSTGENVPTKTITYINGSHGTITGTTTQTVFVGTYGTQVTAVPDTGYRFLQWSDGWKGAARADLAEVKNVSYTAIFQACKTVTYKAGSNGIITGTNPQTIAVGGEGSAVTAATNADYYFTKWSDGVLTSTRTDIGATRNRTITARFAMKPKIAYKAKIHGTITGTWIQVITPGESCTQVTATPNIGYSFVRWSDGGVNATRTDANITKSKTYTATFKKS